jgi:hypothetical protein
LNLHTCVTQRQCHSERWLKRDKRKNTRFRSPFECLRSTSLVQTSIAAIRSRSNGTTNKTRHIIKSLYICRLLLFSCPSCPAVLCPPPSRVVAQRFLVSQAKSISRLRFVAGRRHFAALPHTTIDTSVRRVVSDIGGTMTTDVDLELDDAVWTSTSTRGMQRRQRVDHCEFQPQRQRPRHRSTSIRPHTRSHTRTWMRGGRCVRRRCHLSADHARICSPPPHLPLSVLRRVCDSSIAPHCAASVPLPSTRLPSRSVTHRTVQQWCHVTIASLCAA